MMRLFATTLLFLLGFFAFKLGYDVVQNYMYPYEELPVREGDAPVIEYAQYRDRGLETEKSHVRLHSQGRFRCSGVVIGNNTVLTAAHCGNIGEMVEIVSDSQEVTVLAKFSSALGKQDLAVVTGDFTQFKKSPFEYTKNLFHGETKRPMEACGYPYGSNTYRCYDLTPVKNTFVQEMGIGRLYYGMSGGPVFDKETGLVVGVNSAITDGLVILAPLIGLETILRGL